MDVDTLKRKNLTLTGVLLTGISHALQRYLDEEAGGCPPDLAALVTIAMTAAPTDLGVNRLAGAVVDLHPEIESLPVRAATVQASLERERRINSNEVAVERIRLVNQLPSVLYPWLSRQGRRRGRAAKARGIARLHTVVSSINFGGAAPWSLGERHWRSRPPFHLSPSRRGLPTASSAPDTSPACRSSPPLT
ncbi:hypothetical protein ACFQZK_29985 [Rhodococcus aetherivorans]